MLKKLPAMNLNSKPSPSSCPWANQGDCYVSFSLLVSIKSLLQHTGQTFTIDSSCFEHCQFSPDFAPEPRSSAPDACACASHVGTYRTRHRQLYRPAQNPTTNGGSGEWRTAKWRVRQHTHTLPKRATILIEGHANHLL